MLKLPSSMSEELIQLFQRSGYTLVQNNGQRILSKPGDEGPVPKGCEIFVGKLPKDMFENELIPIFLQVGPIRKFRLMLDFNARSRGFAFVQFYDHRSTDLAVKTLHGVSLKKGHTIGVYKSVDNCRLFVGGIPPAITQKEVVKCLSMYVEGIVQVIMYESHENRNHNRGFAFIEFENHRAAAMARRKLAPGSLVLWGANILVDWADPLPEPDPRVMANVCKLYLRNLPVDKSNQDLWVQLRTVMSLESVVKTHKIMDYAFVHFADRSSAEEGLAILQGVKLWGLNTEVTWARPKMYSKECRMQHPPDNFCLSLPPKMRKLVMNRNKAPANTESNNGSIESDDTNDSPPNHVSRTGCIGRPVTASTTNLPRPIRPMYHPNDYENINLSNQPSTIYNQPASYMGYAVGSTTSMNSLYNQGTSLYNPSFAGYSPTSSLYQGSTGYSTPSPPYRQSPVGYGSSGASIPVGMYGQLNRQRMIFALNNMRIG